MNEPFEEELAERLHARPGPEPATALHLTSVARGEQMRRRRIGAAIGVLVLLLAAPGIAEAWMRVANTDRPPVATSTHPSTPPPGPRAVILDPVGREPGPDIEVSTVRHGEIFLSSGAKLDRPGNQFGTITEFGAEAAWLTTSRKQVFLNLRPEPLPVTGSADSMTGVDPGPNGSVMVRTEAGPLLWTRTSQLIDASQPALQTSAMAATADALWVTTQNGVTRADASDLIRQPYPTKTFTQWKSVVSGDPVADRVVVADRQGCHLILNGSTAAIVWRTCHWEILALSPDSSLAAARNVATGTLEIVDVTSGRLRTLIDTGNNPIGPVFVFDDQNRLNLRVGDDGTSYGFMTVDLVGECWFSAFGPYPTAVHFVTRNRR